MARKIGANSAVVKQQNMEAVKLILYQQAPLSRMDIAARLGLTPPTITNITAELIGQGFVEELESDSDVPARGAGRKPVLIDLKRDSFTALSASPTISIAGIPRRKSTSTLTRAPSYPNGEKL